MHCQNPHIFLWLTSPVYNYINICWQVHDIALVKSTCFLWQKLGKFNSRGAVVLSDATRVQSWVIQKSVAGMRWFQKHNPVVPSAGWQGEITLWANFSKSIRNKAIKTQTLHLWILMQTPALNNLVRLLLHIVVKISNSINNKNVQHLFQQSCIWTLHQF